MNRKGFTLMELLAVIAIIAILAITAIGGYNGIANRSKEKALEAKIKLIETAAEKWAKENNVNRKTTIFVNKLIVLGYLQADSISDDGVAVILNPVDNSNLICKLVDITNGKNGLEADFLEDTNDCSLANQAINDYDIKVQAYTTTGTVVDFEGGSNELNWTKEDVILLIKSPEKYDARAVNLTLDYNGETTTQEKNDNFAEDYASIKEDSWNVFKLPKVDVIYNGEVAITYTLTDGTTKTRVITVKVDKEEATAYVTSENEWLTKEKPINIFIDDGNGSGARGYYISDKANEITDPQEYNFKDTEDKYLTVSKDLPVGTYYIFTVDNAGNVSKNSKATMIIHNIDTTAPECYIEFNGKAGKYNWYKDFPEITMRTSKAGMSGLYYGFNDSGEEEYNSQYIKEGFEGSATLPKITSDTPGHKYYCYVKTAAGKKYKDDRNLKIDTEEPTLKAEAITDGSEYAKTHEVKVTIRDKMSGLLEENIIEYGWSTSETTKPDEWKKLIIEGKALEDDR